jgi:hypothetical protein
MTVIERTSTRLDLKGILDAADLALELDLPGVWARRFTRKVEETLFRPPNVRFIGYLPQNILDAVIKMWEEW